ncbi:MAG: SDR family oxidoreductase [Oscillospiraceae bacterium]
MAKIALVTGGSSGIGLCTARELLKAGCTVYEISRREYAEPGITHLSADVTDEKSVIAAVEKIKEREGRIDILINNAGFGISGAIEFTETEDAKRQLDVNFFGMVNTVRAVLPVMRENGGGRIVNLSSVAAPIPIPFQAYYSVSKAAVNAFSMALANEVRPFGISVCAVMPGDIKTGFTGARKKDCRGDDIYNGRISRSVAVMEHDEETGMAPEAAGRFICRAALKPKVNPLYAIGAQYKLFVFLTRILPCSIINRIIGAIYAK